MKRFLLLLSCFCAFAINDLLAAPPSYLQTKDGVVVFTDPVYTGTSNAVKLEVISDNIIRVTAAPGKEITATQSLITVYTQRPDLFWNVIPTKDSLTLKTKKLTAVIDLKKGAVTFRDNKGRKILAEKQPLAGRFQPVVFEGKPYYALTQTFQSTTGDAWYDLGLITFGPALQYTAEKPADTITINIYSGADASFNLYEDEGINYNYEKGAFSIIPILYNEATKQVTVGKREGGFNGMLQKRTFRINLITPGKTKQLDMDTYDREILYDGKPIEVKL